MGEKAKMTDGAKRRRKGHSFERKIARILRGDESYRSWSTRAVFVHARRGRQYIPGECDVEDTPFWIECASVDYKGNTSAVIRRKWKQAVKEQKVAGDTRPIVIIVNNTLKPSEPIMVDYHPCILKAGVVENVGMSRVTFGLATWLWNSRELCTWRKSE